MKRSIILVVAASAAAGILAGCSSSTPAPSAAGPAPSTVVVTTGAPSAPSSPSPIRTLGTLQETTVVVGDLDLSGMWQAWCYEHQGKPWISLTKDSNSVNVVFAAGKDSIEQISGKGQAYEFVYTVESARLLGYGTPTLEHDGSHIAITGEGLDVAKSAPVTFRVTTTCANWGG